MNYKMNCKMIDEVNCKVNDEANCEVNYEMNMDMNKNCNCRNRSSNCEIKSMPELLAPVGGWAHLNAAVNNGADAVYMGGTLFNARIYAENFTKDDLPQAIDYAHAHNVKVYITLNTLIKDSELLRAFEYAAWLYEIGADAIIIQDLGLARLLHKYLPDFPLHLSTQGSLYNPEALELARELGFSRVVPARELSIREIEAVCREAHALGICDNKAAKAGLRMSDAAGDACGSSDMEIEVFVHGALCMCYSGQCQLSRGLSTKGDSRSGNRGTCAQPCRHAYTDDQGNRSYALSPKDLCYIEHIPELIAAGVNSFKIEGRIKSPEYVALVTRIYRKYIDKYAELLRSNDWNHEVARQAYSVRPQDINYLKQAFNRGGFTTGYLFGNPGRDILSGSSPKNQGVAIGRVVAIIDNEAQVDNIDDRRAVRGALKRGRMLVCIAADGETGFGSREAAGSVIAMGDGVEFRGDSIDYEGNPIGNVVTYVHDLGDGLYIIGDFERTSGGDLHNRENNQIHDNSTGHADRRMPSSGITVGIGDTVYKVTSKQLNDAVMDVPDKKLPVTFSFTARIEQYMSLIMTDVKSGYSTELIGNHIVEAANKTATDAERIIAQLCRLGDTPYEADANSCDIELDEGAMVPVSLINKMRRECADRLLDERINGIKIRRQALSRGKLDVIAAKELLGVDVLDFSVAEENYKRTRDGRLKLLPIEEYMKQHSSISESSVKNNKLPAVLPYVLNISKGNLDTYLEENFDAITCAVRETGILIGNLGWIKRFIDAGVTVYADFGLNIYNRQAAKLREELGLAGYGVSCEAGIADSRGLPLMITEHPIESSYLIDRKGKKHTVQAAPSGDKYLIF